MPHRVASFFRNPTSSIENQVIQLKKSTIRSRTKSPNRPTLADRVHSYASSVEEEAAAAAAATSPMDEHSPSPVGELAHPPNSSATSSHNNSNTSISSSSQPQHPVQPSAVARLLSDSPRLRPHDSDSSTASTPKKEKDHHHRLSFPGIHLGRITHHSSHNKDKDSSHHSSHSKNAHATLSCRIESPPIILYGDAEASTGALVSGQLFLDIPKDEAGYEIATFKATLQCHVTQKKPSAPHCADCANQFTLLKEWEFLPPGLGTHKLAKGTHPFPFSVLLPGHLPATLDTPLVSIAYEFKAEAIPAAWAGSLPASGTTTPTGSTSSSSHHNSHNSQHSPIKLEKLFEIKRSLPPPELPHHSVRVFPPTNVKASVHYQQVIHPIGTNTLTMRLDGIAKTNAGGTTVEYWKLKKLTWRLEETLKTVAPACDKHKPNTLTPTSTGEDQAQQQAAENNKKNGTPRVETRIIGEKTLFNGWKSTYAGPTDSSVELELEYTLNKHAKFACDLRNPRAPQPEMLPDGTMSIPPPPPPTMTNTEVTHQLMLEMVVSQECAPVGKPGLVTQTGVGRILRMHFGTVLTERGGIGISWDNEAPPIYQDVPASPPAYYSGDGIPGGPRFGLEGLPDVMESLDAAGTPIHSARPSRRNSAEVPR